MGKRWNPLGFLRRKQRFVVREGEREREDQIYYAMAGTKRHAHRTWYRGEHTNFHPVRDSLSEPDAFRTWVGKGWLPDRPFIDRETYITAFGSCFAAEVTKFLHREGYKVFGRDLKLNAHIVRSGEGIVNTAALRQQFEWAFGTANPTEGTWHDRQGKLLEARPDEQEATRSIFLSSDVFILTLGLSEVWYDRQTGDAFWRGIPSTQFDPDRHGFRVLGVEENRANLERVREIIRHHRPDASIITTLSPVPLAATFRPVSCITANAVSKASLRVAIDEMMRAHPDDRALFYFPSYEMVTAVIPDAMDDDLRHPRKEVIARIMEEFRSAYLI
jgi:hypothetical protein